MPLFSRQPLALTRCRRRSCELSKRLSSSSASPFPHRLSQHLASRISHFQILSVCCYCYRSPFFLFFLFFPKRKEIFRYWNLFSFLAFFWCCFVRVFFFLVMIFLTSAVFASAIMPILSTCDGCT